MSDATMKGGAPVIAGKHPIRSLGTGGFAEVYLYRQDLPNRNVAVKVLTKEIEDEDSLRMFNNEADSMALLSAHPSVLSIYEANVSADGHPYLVLEYCPTNFAKQYREVFLPVSTCLDVGVRIAGAVETAHRSGILHRDIKPSNVLVTEFGVPVLSDFGIAKMLGRDERGVYAMSAQWSAPEIVDGDVSGSVAADIWGLSATVYALLAGRNPFELTDSSGDTKEKFLDRIRRADYVPTGRKDISPELERLLRRGLSKDPEDRHPSAAVFAQDLRRIQDASGYDPTPLEFYSASADASFAPELRGGTRVVVESPAPRTKRPRNEKQAVKDEPRNSTVSAKWVVLIVVATVLLTVIVMLGFGNV